jgi:hypothetical protein
MILEYMFLLSQVGTRRWRKARERQDIGDGWGIRGG